MLAAGGQHKIGVLSDAHGNYAAFLQALAVLRARGAAEIIFLGDAVGYIPSPRVVEELRRMGDLKFCIRGNHEEMLLNGNGPTARDAIYQLRCVSSRLSESDFAFLSSWPPSREMECPAGRLLFVHGSPDDNLLGYVYPDSPLGSFTTNAEFVFMGHTHRPFVRTEGATTFINVGSCGLPRDDGRFGSAALFDPATGECTILRFDIADSTRESLAATTDIHQAVTELLARRCDSVAGQFV